MTCYIVYSTWNSSQLDETDHDMLYSNIAPGIALNWMRQIMTCYIVYSTWNSSQLDETDHDMLYSI